MAQVFPVNFKRLYLHLSIPQKKEGNGIGLSIAHRIVRLHQGELQVSSIPDVQTCFSLHLPLYEHKE